MSMPVPPRRWHLLGRSRPSPLPRSLEAAAGSRGRLCLQPTPYASSRAWYCNPMSEPNRRLSPEEYLALERQSELRHEFLDGEVFAMAGASLHHNRIVRNVGGTLYSQLLGRPCEVFFGDMRLRVDATGLY